jgi:Ser/Thr protein kinase RdoA (MazF antagonist)
MDDVLASEIAAAYAIGAIRDCTRYDRDSSSVVRVDTNDRVYWLKLAVLTNPDLDDLEAEAEVATTLAEHGIAVARAIRRGDGRYAGRLVLAGGAVAALLFEEAPGEPVVEPTLAQAESLGTLLARFHGTVVEPAARRWRIDAEALAAAPMRSVLAWLNRAGGAVTRDAARTSDKLASIASEMVAIAAFDELPLGLCHGDLWLENVRFAGTSPTLFDLECCGIGPCSYDLACYWRKRIGLADAEAPLGEWEAVLRGYEQIRTLTACERRAIPALATLRAIWVMAMPMMPGTRWGQDWLDLDYLEAHVTMIERLACAARD